MIWTKNTIIRYYNLVILLLYYSCMIFIITSSLQLEKEEIKDNKNLKSYNSTKNEIKTSEKVDENLI